MPHITSTTLPADIARALADCAQDWRESRLPEPLRNAGVHGLAFEPRGAHGFRLTLEGVQSRLGARCDGAITADAMGTIVSYEVAPVLDPPTVFGIVLLLTGTPVLWDIWRGDGTPTAIIWPLLGAAALSGLAALEATRLRNLLEPGVRALLMAVANGKSSELSDRGDR